MLTQSCLLEPGAGQGEPQGVGKGSHAAFIARPDIAASLILKAIGTTWGPPGRA